MDLAIVRGQCTATVKDASLAGRRLALVQAVTPEGESRGPVEVALDVTSAAPGTLVLLARGSAARLPVENRQVAVDLSIVAIVDDVTMPGTQPAAATSSAAAKTPAAAKKTAKTAKSARKTATGPSRTGGRNHG
jgi:ethanolamine utilization protein EutN